MKHYVNMVYSVKYYINIVFVVEMYVKYAFELFFRILFGTLRAVVCILIVMFGFIPVLFRYTYPLQRTVIFLNFGEYNL